MEEVTLKTPSDGRLGSGEVKECATIPRRGMHIERTTGRDVPKD